MGEKRAKKSGGRRVAKRVVKRVARKAGTRVVKRVMTEVVRRVRTALATKVGRRAVLGAKVEVRTKIESQGARIDPAAKRPRTNQDQESGAAAPVNGICGANENHGNLLCGEK